VSPQIPFSLLIVLLLPLSLQAESLKCSGSGVTIEGVGKTAPDAYGDTMDVKVTLPGKPTRYEHAHPVSLKDGVTYTGAMSYDGFKDRLLIALGASSGAGQYQGAKLKMHFNDYVYKEAYPGYWDYVPEEVNHAFDVNCRLTPDNGNSNVCDGKSPAVLERLLLTGAAEKSVDTVTQAISCGANPNAALQNGCTALMLASETSYFDCGIKPKATDNLIFARARSIFSSLLDAGAYSVQADSDGRTVLHKLVRNGEEKLLKDLVDLAEDLDAQDHEGTTPLMLAAGTGYANAVKILVSGGANLELKNSSGQTAYDLGDRLDTDTRNLLLQPSVTIQITGQDNGSCTPKSVDVPAGKAVKLKFTASKSKMFTFSIPSLNISVMPDAGQTVEKTFTTPKPGAYPFQCGVMGGSQMTGTINAK
jgi:plastocyanin